MSTGNPWAPNESEADIISERLSLAGLFIGAAAFGVHLTLFCWCMHVIYNKKKRTRHDWYKFTYLWLVFILSNIGNGTYLKWGQMTWIDNRNYPGGPNAYYLEQTSLLVPAMVNGAYIIATWFQDGLLLYRLWIIYGGNWLIVAVPSAMFITSVVFATYLLAVLVKPGITFQSPISVKVGIPYWSISFALHVLITSLIAGRLLHMRHRLRRITGLDASVYFSITAVLVESATLYTVSGIAFIIPFAMQNAAQNLFLPLLGQTQSIAPVLVVLRSLLGRAWTSNTMADLDAATTSIQFNGFSHVADESQTMHSTTVVYPSISKAESHVKLAQQV